MIYTISVFVYYYIGSEDDVSACTHDEISVSACGAGSLIVVTSAVYGRSYFNERCVSTTQVNCREDVLLEVGTML